MCRRTNKAELKKNKFVCVLHFMQFACAAFSTAALSFAFTAFIHLHSVTRAATRSALRLRRSFTGSVLVCPFSICLQNFSIKLFLMLAYFCVFVVDAPPVLLYSFIEQTLQPGPAVSLKCSAAGNPTPQISWTLDGFPLPSNGR